MIYTDGATEEQRIRVVGSIGRDGVGKSGDDAGEMLAGVWQQQ